jgi:AraC family ethanolamine operon transcriptional activator
MAQPLTSSFAFRDRFPDFEVLADAIRAWDLDFRQLDPGNSPAELAQVGAGPLLFTHACFNRKYDQHGGSPHGSLTFALLEPGVNGVIWCGRPATDQTLLMFDNSGAFEAVSQPGFRVFTFTLPEDQLLETARTLGVKQLEQITCHTDNAIELTPMAARMLHRQMAQLTRTATLDPTLLDIPEFLDEIEYELPARLVEAVELSATKPLRPSLRARHKALRHALDYINTSPHKVCSVRDLCRITGVSERTLEYAFKERYGISPKRYLRDIRLNAAHKALVKASSGDVRIADIANHHGFWHMGQFAADYKSLFGRLPSEVLKKNIKSGFMI